MMLIEAWVEEKGWNRKKKYIRERYEYEGCKSQKKRNKKGRAMGRRD